jgi:hypothetical protein
VAGSTQHLVANGRKREGYHKCRAGSVRGDRSSGAWAAGGIAILQLMCESPVRDIHSDRPGYFMHCMITETWTREIDGRENEKSQSPHTCV